MRKYWIYETTPVEFSGTADKLAIFEASNEHLEGSEVDKENYDLAKIAEDEKEKKFKRKQAIKDGDFLNAVMAQMNQDRIAGKAMVPEMDTAIDDWNALEE